MKFYSENLNKLFDSEKELKEAEAEKAAAEAEAKAKKEALTKERKARAEVIEDLLKQRKVLDKKIHEALKDFTKDYGSFHTSYSNAEDLFDSFWDWFL